MKNSTIKERELRKQKEEEIHRVKLFEEEERIRCMNEENSLSKKEKRRNDWQQRDCSNYKNNG